jgi:hypothetical protein
MYNNCKDYFKQNVVKYVLMSETMQSYTFYPATFIYGNKFKNGITV